MKHLDLFSGIGGFAYAADQVWDNVEHTFCDNNEFCQAVLRKHWPESEIIDDIRTITAKSISQSSWRKDNGRVKNQGRETSSDRAKSLQPKDWQASSDNPQQSNKVDLLTGGFPCQPFSAAGVRRGTADERYLWPEMLRVIRLTQPTWVIAENVRGLLTWENGLVFEQICTDLENSLYQVQPFIIPAVAVNAPHRRDRIWWVARNTEYDGFDATQDGKGDTQRVNDNQKRQDKLRQSKGASSLWETIADSRRKRTRGKEEPERTSKNDPRYSWSDNWVEVATYASRVDDGLPDRVDRIKALGNAIVPQVAIEIMQGIKLAE